MSETATRTRAPRGTKTVTDAFFAALLAIPEARQTEVARAAQIAIRDELKVMRDKTRAAASKAKLRRVSAEPAPKKTRGPARTKPAVAKKPVRTTRARRTSRSMADAEG